MTYTPNKSNQQAAETTITVEPPSLDEAWDDARKQNERGLPTSEAFDRFVALTKTLVGVSKRDLARAEADRRAEALIRDSGERNARGDLPAPDDPQLLKDRIERLKRA